MPWNISHAFKAEGDEVTLMPMKHETMIFAKKGMHYTMIL
jgi:hypothetical protein